MGYDPGGYCFPAKDLIFHLWGAFPDYALIPG